MSAVRVCLLLTAGLLFTSACQKIDNRLVSEAQIEGDAIPLPISDVSASATLGREIFTDRNGGHCVLCHAINSLDAEFQGNVGPDLSDVGAKLSAAQIRFRIVDLQSMLPDTVMPSYYRLHNLNQVETEYSGRTMLTADEIEHLVAYLASLTEET